MRKSYLGIFVGVIMAGAAVSPIEQAAAAAATGNDSVDGFLSQLEAAGGMAIAYGQAEARGDDVILTDVILDFEADAPDLTLAEVQFLGAQVGDDDRFLFAQLRVSEVSMTDEEGAFSLAHLEMSGVELARAQTSAPGAITKGAELQDFMPIYTSLALSDVDLQLFGDEPREVSVDTIFLSMSDYVDGIPLFSQADVIGISIPASALNDPRAEEMLSELALDELTAHLSARTRIDPDERLVFFEDYRLDVDEMGTIRLEAGLGNVGIEQLADLQRAKTKAQSQAAFLALLSATLDELSVTVEDSSMTAKFLALGARLMGVSEAELIVQAQFMLPLALRVLDNAELQAKLTQEILVFLKDPQSFHLAINPAAPVPLGDLLVGSQQLDALIAVLNLDVVANEKP